MRLLPFLLACCLLLGCGQNLRPPRTVPVSGSVKWKGQPAAGVIVRFHPLFDIGKHEFIPSGETNAEGKFVLSTGQGGDGAPPGDYVVTLEKPRIESDTANSGIEIEVDEFAGKYSNPNLSDRDVTIGAGSNVLDPFEVD